MHALAALPFVIAAFWLGVAFARIRDLRDRQRQSLEGVTR